MWKLSNHYKKKISKTKGTENWFTKKVLRKYITRILETYAHNYWKHRGCRYRQSSSDKKKKTRKVHGHLSEWFVLRPVDIIKYIKETTNPENIVKYITEIQNCYSKTSPLLENLKILCRDYKKDMKLLIGSFLPNPKNKQICSFKSSSAITQFDKKREVRHAANQKQVRHKVLAKGCNTYEKHDSLLQLHNDELPLFKYQMLKTK